MRLKIPAHGRPPLTDISHRVTRPELTNSTIALTKLRQHDYVSLSSSGQTLTV